MQKKKKQKLDDEEGDVEEGECSDESELSSIISSEDEATDVVIAREALIEGRKLSWNFCKTEECYSTSIHVWTEDSFLAGLTG